MPESVIEVGEGVSPYFNSLPQALPDPRNMATTIGDSFGSLARTGMHASTVLSELIGQSARNTRAGRVTSVDKFVDAYRPLLIDLSDALSKEPDEETLKIMACTNQRLAQSLYLAGLKPPNDPMRLAATYFIEIIQKLSENDFSIGQIILQRFTGARAQAALMRLLGNNGYTLIVPDPDNPDEVYRWDVAGGVDFAALSPDRSILCLIDAKGSNKVLIDAKGSNKVNQPDIKKTHTAPAELSLHRKIKEDVAALCTKKFNRPYIPTTIQTIPLQITIPADPKSLGNFGELDDTIGKAVIAGIERRVY